MQRFQSFFLCGLLLRCIMGLLIGSQKPYNRKSNKVNAKNLCYAKVF
nr:MAG TPA: hypothetical protein [Caudoviricetes sp.]